jgi:glycosyltransferase involved in cell wall biosynthesis
MEKKKNLLIYTGHNELIGGDAYYMFNILNRLDYCKFNVELYTDVNKLFNNRAKAWSEIDLNVNYINTRPILFRKFWFDTYYDKIADKDSHIINKLICSFLNIGSGKIRLRNILRFVFKRIALRRFRGLVLNFFLFYRLFKEKKGEVDIFHFNNGGYPAKEAGLVALMVAKMFKVKVIVKTLHNIAEKKTLRKPLGYFYDYFVPRATTKIISTSDAVGNALIERRKFPRDKITTIRCGLDSIEPLSRLKIEQKRDELNVADNQQIIIITGNIEEKRKGHEELFQALAIVKEMVPNVLLLVIGNGSEERMNHLNNCVEKLGIQKNIRFMGYRTDIFELNSVADFTLTPSVGIESIPFTIIEGARLGKPVITTTVGACSEAVIHNETGFVVKPFDIEDLADKIITILNDKDMRKRMGEKAVELFTERFLLSKTVCEHEDIYLQQN